MLFSEVVGQSAVKNRLVQMYHNGRVPHAMLFLGQEGNGSLPLAIAFAQYINCTDPAKHDGEACGRCSSCVKYNHLTHPDLHFIFPIIKKEGSSTVYSDTYIDEWRAKFVEEHYFSLPQWLSQIGGDKQGIISKDDAVAIHQKLGQKSVEADYKVLIMWCPELMNETASNRILKILEEPPAKTIFILVSDNEADILPTILSRTQRFNIPPIEDEALVNHVMRLHPSVPEEKVRRMVHISAGSMVRLNQIIHPDEDSKDNLEFFMSLMRIGYQRNIVSMTAFTEEIKKLSREALKARLNYSIHMIREALVYNLQNSQLSNLTGDEEKFLTRFALFVHHNNAFQIIELLNKAYLHVERNGSASMIFFDILMQMASLLKVKP